MDRRNEPGQLILTGSTVVDESAIMHSGIERISRVDMHTMSLHESQELNGTVSLRSLFEGEDLHSTRSDLDLEGIACAVCRGGWPASISMSESSALMVARFYLDGICETDVSRVGGVSKAPNRVRALLRSHARNVSVQSTNGTILNDIIQNDVDMTEPTMYSYISVLKRLYVIEDAPAWNPALRSATSMRSLDKKGFADPSIASAALGFDPERLIREPETFGFLFLHLRNGDYALIEIKLGEKGAEEGHPISRPCAI